VFSALSDFNAGSQTDLIIAADIIANWNVGAGNQLYFAGNNLAAVSHAGTAVAGQASISATGLATFDAADSTLALKVAAVVSATGTDDVGTSVVFNEGSDAYLFVVGDSTAGVQAGDALIKLTGVSATQIHIDNGIITGF
jgi:hypothetical protein